MSELWDVYTIDRKLIGKTCIRGEQGKLADDEFHLWVELETKARDLPGAIQVKKCMLT
ncbi:hypothetical protein [Butyrivibrio proteoclasticus]|uniref:hypothetical protein n=1 Tax=Butyrivibrio proteoclasticus TaxID=43305 RepID=UPI000B03F406|nr:hypothetical protein [Butyrivibrio proteoclasticus]